MDAIQVNIHILGMKPGDIVRAGDKFYEDLRRWAMAGDTRNGSIICVAYTAPTMSDGVEDAGSDTVGDMIADDGVKSTADNFVGDDVANHKLRDNAKMERLKANGNKKR